MEWDDGGQFAVDGRNEFAAQCLGEFSSLLQCILIHWICWAMKVVETFWQTTFLIPFTVLCTAISR